MIVRGWLLALALLAPSARAQEAAPLGATMEAKAKAFLASLGPEQTKLAAFSFDASERKDWHWIPKPRKGLTIGAMSAPQKEAALALLNEALSESGQKKAKTIMGLEEVLRVQEKDDSGRRDVNKYHWCVFGTPAPKGRWGYGVEGHHLSVNVTVVDGQVVSATPLFMGANPREMNAKFPGAPDQGHLTIDAEERLALELVASLDETQFSKAFQAKATPKEIVTGPPSSLWSKEPVGLPASKMGPEQRATLQKLLTAYGERLAPELGAPILKEVESAGLDEVHFAWFGSKARDEAHHYRIQGPTFLLDFDNSQADPLGNPANHIHSLWRSKSNDFGAGL